MHVVHSAKDAARLPKKPTAFDFLIISYNFVQKMVRWREGGGAEGRWGVGGWGWVGVGGGGVGGGGDLLGSSVF